jgi:hypothetical protein
MTNPAITKALPDIPLEQVKAAMDQHPEVRLVIKRHTAKGTWASLPSYTMVTAELASIEEWLRENHGGGRYRVSPRNPQNELEEVTAPFYVEIAGAPRTEQQPMRQRAPSPFGQPITPLRSGIPSWPQMPNIREARRDEGPDFDPSQFMTQTPDAIAMEQVRVMREELRDLRADNAKLLEVSERKLEAERAERARADKDHLKFQQAHDKEIMDFRMQLIAAQSTPKVPQIDWVPLIVAAVPVVTALITSGKDRQALQLNAQQEAAKLQSQQTQAIFGALDKGHKPDTGLKDMLALAMPLVIKIMDEKSPSAVTKLISAMADNQLQTISMVGQLMQQMAPDDSNPWMDVARKAIEGVQSVAEQMVEVQAVKTGTARARVQQSAPPQSTQKALSPASTPAEFADALFNAPNLPAELKTQTWYELFAMMHDVKQDPRETAIAISKHLESLADANKLPAMFAGVLEDDGKPPSTHLRPFLDQLPLAQLSPQRLNAICTAFDEVLTADDEAPANSGTEDSFGQTFVQA